MADRKIHKFIRRSEVLGLCAATQAIDAGDLLAHRHTLQGSEIDTFDDRTGVYVGSGGCAFQHQYGFFPLLSHSDGGLQKFGQGLTQTLNPLWLLTTLPNNVLCHIGIKYRFKGPNACITNHSVSGALAVAEAVAALRSGEADRALAVGHDTPVEPQQVRYYASLGLLTAEAVRPFDTRRSGSVLGEGAAALTLETESAARARGARVLGEVLGSGCTSEAEGLLPVRADGDGLSRAIALALDDAGLRAPDVGMVVAHGNGTQQSDQSEAAAIQRALGSTPPPVTAFKWAFGHLLAASGILEMLLALLSLRAGTVPGVATLHTLDPRCAPLSVSPQPQTPRGGVGLVLCRGFAGTNVALLIRASSPTESR